MAIATKYIGWLLTLLLFLLGNPNTFAQVAVDAQLDSTYIRTGDRLRLQLQLRHTPGLKVLDPDLSPLGQVENLEILEERPWDTLGVSPDYILEKDVYLTAWDSGYYEVPRLAVVYQHMDKSDTLYTPSIPLKVDLLPADTFELAPIQSIMEEPRTIEDILTHPALLIMIGLAIFTGIFLLIWRRNKGPATPRPEVRRPPHEIALEKLQLLEASRLWQQGQIKQYHSDLTHIFREYLENRFAIQALEQTTPEILQQLPDQLASTFRQQIRELLQTADLVKFAKAKPPEDFHRQAMVAVRAFIEQTPPPEEPEQKETDQ